MSSKSDPQFPKVLWVWKLTLALAKGTFIVARKSPAAILGRREARVFPHAAKSTPDSIDGDTFQKIETAPLPWGSEVEVSETRKAKPA